MSDRDRLAKLIRQGRDICNMRSCDKCERIDIPHCSDRLIADHLLTSGKVVVLPCKVGDTVWTIAPKYRICENYDNCDSGEYLTSWCQTHCPNGYQGTGVIQGTLAGMKLSEYRIVIDIRIENVYLRMPTTNVFLTKEEAERKLKELEGDKK